MFTKVTLTEDDKNRIDLALFVAFTILQGSQAAGLSQSDVEAVEQELVGILATAQRVRDLPVGEDRPAFGIGKAQIGFMSNN